MAWGRHTGQSWPEGEDPGAVPPGLGNCPPSRPLHKALDIVPVAQGSLDADCRFSAAGRQRTQACHRIADTRHLDQGCFHQ